MYLVQSLKVLNEFEVSELRFSDKWCVFTVLIYTSDVVVCTSYNRKDYFYIRLKCVKSSDNNCKSK